MNSILSIHRLYGKIKLLKEMTGTAMPQTIIQRWNELTKDEQEQTATFIAFLLLRRKQKQKAHFEFGALEGGHVCIADDFDETPEEFKEYL